MTGTGISCGNGATDCSESYSPGTPVTLTETPAGGATWLISQANLSVQQGPVTVRLPFSAGYPAGQYGLWAAVSATGEKKLQRLHWKVQVL